MRLKNDQAINESQACFGRMRLSSWARPSWNGLNQVLPSVQAQILHFQAASIAVQGLCNALRLSHEKTGKVHLDVWHIRCILSEGFLSSSRYILPSSVGEFVRTCYGDVLRKRGPTYESRSCQTLRLLVPILWGLAQ